MTISSGLPRRRRVVVAIVLRVLPRVSEGHADLASSSPSSPHFVRKRTKGNLQPTTYNQQRENLFSSCVLLVVSCWSHFAASAQSGGQSRLTHVTGNEGCVR